MMSEGGGMWFGGGFGWIFWIAVIIAVVWVVQAVSDKSSVNQKSPEDSPLDILKKRYAHGEIDDQEYERKRKQL